MKYDLEINEQSQKGKDTLEAVKNLEVNLEKIHPETISSVNLGMPGYPVTQEQMRKWLSDSEKNGEIDFSSIAEI